MNSKYNHVFKKGSNTYYYSSVFFPPKIRKKVTVLYTFVRIIDDLVDNVPQKKEEFYKKWQKFNKNKKSKIDFLDDFKKLMKKTDIDKEWVEAFWKSMEMDLIRPIHKNLKETEEYMYGSAEVIGLIMAKIMNLPPEAGETARKLGKAMQYANFIRDVDEDMKMNRDYLQVVDNKDFGEKFKLFNDRFDKWQTEAEEGYKYIPRRYLVPIKTAAEMYKWTIKKIGENPMIVFEKKIKPSKLRILTTGLWIWLTT